MTFSLPEHWDPSGAALRCDHLTFRHQCEECGAALSPAQRSAFTALITTHKQRRRQARRARVAAAREELRAQTPPPPAGATGGRRRRVRFRLDDGVPGPVKHRELLYRDYCRSGEGLAQQWAERLATLGRSDRWWAELAAIVGRRLGHDDQHDHKKKKKKKSRKHRTELPFVTLDLD